MQWSWLACVPWLVRSRTVFRSNIRKSSLKISHAHCCEHSHSRLVLLLTTAECCCYVLGSLCLVTEKKIDFCRYKSVYFCICNSICWSNWVFHFRGSKVGNNRADTLHDFYNYCPRFRGARSLDQVTLAPRSKAKFVLWQQMHRWRNSEPWGKQGQKTTNLLNPVLLHLNKTAERGYVDFSGCTANVWDRLDVSITQEPLKRTENPSRSFLPN